MFTDIILDEVNYQIKHHRTYSGCKQTYEQPSENPCHQIDRIMDTDENKEVHDVSIGIKIIEKLNEHNPGIDFEY